MARFIDTCGGKGLLSFMAITGLLLLSACWAHGFFTSTRSITA
jgi:hypothetical protein